MAKDDKNKNTSPFAGIDDFVDLREVLFADKSDAQMRKLRKASSEIIEILCFSGLSNEEVREKLRPYTGLPLKFDPTVETEAAAGTLDECLYDLLAEMPGGHELLSTILDAGFGQANIFNSEHMLNMMDMGASTETLDMWLGHFPDHAHGGMEHSLLDKALEHTEVGEDPDDERAAELVRWALKRGCKPARHQNLCEFFNSNQPNGVLDAWVEHFPHEVRSRYVTSTDAEERSSNLVDIAISNDEPRLLKWALEHGASFREAHINPLERFAGESNPHFDLLGALAEHGGLRIDVASSTNFTLAPEDERDVMMTCMDHSESFYDNRAALVLIGELKMRIHMLEQRLSPDMLDSITPQDVNLCYSMDKLHKLFNPELWKGHEEQLVKLAMEVPDNVYADIERYVGHIIREYRDAASYGQMVSGPFELDGAIATTAAKEGERGK